jgi:hypothetical protein
MAGQDPPYDRGRNAAFFVFALRNIHSNIVIAVSWVRWKKSYVNIKWRSCGHNFFNSELYLILRSSFLFRFLFCSNLPSENPRQQAFSGT